MRAVKKIVNCIRLVSWYGMVNCKIRSSRGGELYRDDDKNDKYLMWKCLVFIFLHFIQCFLIF